MEEKYDSVENIERIHTLNPEPTQGHGFDQVQYQRDHLSPEHREYLLSIYGSLEHLDPIPDMSPADPYNWPSWKKRFNLALVAFHAMMATFSAASIQSAFFPIHLALGVSIQRTTYLVSLFIAILGGAPLFWRPMANRFGRRPIFLLSLSLSLIGNIGCYKSPSYATLGLCRAIVAFFISPAAAIGSAVVAETFFKKYRARAMGIWTLLLTIGVPIAPLVTGPLAEAYGWRSIFVLLAIINAVQLLLYTVFGPETRYIREETPSAAPNRVETGRFTFRRIDPTPITFTDFVQPLYMAAKPCVLLPACIYAMVFLWASIAITILIPQIYPFQFGFDTVQIGLQSIALIVGSILGEQVGGLLSDFWMSRPAKRPPHEHRLWLGYIGHALAICGVVVFLMQTGNAGPRWNITPLIGAAIAASGNQIVTTVFITYAVDCYRQDAGSVGVFISFVRQTWGFIGPFWFSLMITRLGYGPASGVIVAMLVLVSVIPTVLLQWKGHQWR